MNRLSILSVVTASLLLVGCSDEAKAENSSVDELKANKTLYIKSELKQEVIKKVEPKVVVNSRNSTSANNLSSNILKLGEIKAQLEIQREQLEADKVALAKEKEALNRAREELAIGVEAIIKAKVSLEKEKALLSKISKNKIVAVRPIIKVTPVVAVKPIKVVTPIGSSVAPVKEVTPIKKASSPKIDIKVTNIGDKSVGDIIKASLGDSKAEVKSESNATEAPFDYKLKPKQIAENVWCFFGALDKPTKENAGFMVNSCYIKTNDGYLAMDTGPSYQFAKQSYEAMQKIEDLPVKYVVNSHEHDDHWLGNDFFKKKFGTNLIGPESINKNYKDGDKTRMYNILPDNAIKGTHIIRLDKTPKEPYTLMVGGEEFRIIPMDVKAHTGDDIFIYMPKRKILFAGDLVMNGRITSGRHGSVMGQLKALAMMQKLDWKILVPGHGFITDGTAMDEAKMYFQLTKDRILKAIDEGVDATEINEVVKLIEFKDKAMYDILNAHNVGFAFEELEMLDEDE